MTLGNALVTLALIIASAALVGWVADIFVIRRNRKKVEELIDELKKR